MNDTQKCILDIFKAVDRICRNNNVPYYAIGGTCIGAVRHSGFIPWDDDLDIAVRIEDFDRLRGLLEKELPPYYRVHDCNNTKRFHFVFMKVEDVRTAFIEEEIIQHPSAYTGVFIDIMPLSGVPAAQIIRLGFALELGVCKTLNSVRRFPFRSQNSKKGRAASTLLKLPVSAFDYKSFSNLYLDLLRKHPVSEADHVGYVWVPKYLMKLTFPSEWFSDTADLPFEDTKISCPAMYHEYLTQQFGDYMTPPPRERQKSPHKGIIDLERSFREYQ